MPINVNSAGLAHARNLVRMGKINRNSSWSFSASDGNALLGENDDWANYGRFHLAVDTDEPDNTKNYWKYPYGKGGQVYRRGVIAAKQRAAAQGENAIVNAANELLEEIDKEEKSKARNLFDQLKELLFKDDDKKEEDTKEVTTDEILDSGFIVQKEMGDGTARWFAWVTNKWEDRDGHILTDSAHREYAAFLDANPQYAPELWVWHVPGTARKNRADWWHYADGFFMYSGILTEEEAEFYKDMDTSDIGMSHGFFVLKYDSKNRHVLKYRTFEVSDLPRDSASNPFTSFAAIKEAQEKMLDNPAKRKYLVSRLGEDKVAEIEALTEGKKEALEELGINMKELEQEVAAQEAAEFEERVTAAVLKATEQKTELITKVVAEQVVEAMNPDGLQDILVQMQKDLAELATLKEKVGELETAIQVLKESDDVKIAAAVTPMLPISWGKSTDESVQTEDGVDPDNGGNDIDNIEDAAIKEAAHRVATKNQNGWLYNAVSLE